MNWTEFDPKRPDLYLKRQNQVDPALPQIYNLAKSYSYFKL